MASVAPTKRTTAKKAAPVISFDAARRRKAPRYKYEAFGRVWNVKSPNQAKASRLFEGGDASAMVNLLADFVVKEERQAFIDAAVKEEDFGFEEIKLMIDQLSEVTIPAFPTDGAASS